MRLGVSGFPGEPNAGWKRFHNIAVGKCPRCKTTLIFSIYPDLSGKYMVSKKLVEDRKGETLSG
jgi:hypothetical protein